MLSFAYDCFLEKYLCCTIPYQDIFSFIPSDLFSNMKAFCVPIDLQCGLVNE